MTKKSEIALPEDIKKDALEVDPEEPKAVLNLVLNAFERGVKLGKEFRSESVPAKKKSIWD